MYSNLKARLCCVLLVLAVATKTYGQTKPKKTEPETEMKVFSLQHVDAEAASKMIRELIGANSLRIAADRIR